MAYSDKVLEATKVSLKMLSLRPTDAVVLLPLVPY